MIDDVKVAGGKISLGVLGAAISAITLNQWVAITTIIYFVLQSLHLLWAWHKEHRDGG